MGFSQTERRIHGQVTTNGNPINDVEVINLTTKSVTNTGRDGLFAIMVNPRDVIVFVSKNHETKKVYLNQTLIDKDDFKIVLTQKNEQLSEVLVTSEKKAKYDSQKMVDGQYFDDAQSSPKNRFIYDGTIENGANFVRIYKDIVKAFRKDKEDKKKSETVPFKTHVLTNYDATFFAKTLDIKQEEIVPFLEFCETDPKSKTITEDSNVLAVLEFLMTKNAAFKKTSQ